MKKDRYLPILLLAVFLMLCACAQNVTDQPETTPSSSSVQLDSKPATKPISTPTIIPTVVTQPTTKPTATPTKPTTAPTHPITKPTAAPTQPTTRPTVPPSTQPTVPVTYPPAPPVSLPELPSVPETAYPAGFITRDWTNNYRNAYFCWRVYDTRESIIICNEWVPAFTGYEEHIYFVKESEPNRIYVIAKGDFQNHQLYYESPYGNITYIRFESQINGYLYFIADKQRFYSLNLSTGETTLLMKQDDMDYAGINWWDGNMLWFEGRPLGGGRYGQYDYDPVTGKSTYQEDQL